MMDSDERNNDNSSSEIDLLLKVSRILDSSTDLKQVLTPVLNVIAQELDIKRGSLALLNRETGEITIESAYGLSQAQMERGRYKIGEGITGEVFRSGRPAIIPKISDEPRFLDKTKSRKKDQSDLSFLCVPIKLESRVIGAICADKYMTNSESLASYTHLLSIVASMIAQAVRLRQLVQEERHKIIEENTRLQEELRSRFKPENIIGNSQAIQEVYSLIEQVSKSDATVLVRGESGTGKELVAHAIHYHSARAGKPFVKVSCAALPESIIESELFGHEKGAFTGAVSSRKGRFELADGGTLFLDEIGDLSAALQVKLLRVLQEKEFERVGGIKTIHVNVRVIAATNRDLETLMEEGSFRQDLYYRLNVFPIHIPPLRERKTDILLLADFFIEQYGRKNGKNVRRISTPAIDMLMAYHWPGNVRELENCIERAVLLTKDDVIHGHHLPPTLQTAEASGTAFRGRLRAVLGNVEKELILDALKSSRGNQTRAADMLGISERIMGLRIKKYGIDTSRFFQ
ncbi:MAG: nif-specific transcriptional activator NifA [Spirochaetales bacterium]|nr:nif-specific transcriptional activator NifA [Spirochaetales bacterium]